jgi:peptide methionine sulfoxide reductase MsrA
MIALIAGCPYSSSVPIDDGTVKVPDGIEGKWIKSADKESENPTYYEIKKDDKTHATALKYEFNSSDSVYESVTYHFTFSDVDGEIFLNALEEGGSTYSLFKFEYDATTSEITTYEVTDYIKESFSTSTELKSYISKNKAVSYFYTNTIDTYVRM